MHIFDMSYRFRAKPTKNLRLVLSTPNLQNLSQGCPSSFCFWLRTDSECSLAELPPLHPTIHPNYEVINLNNALLTSSCCTIRSIDFQDSIGFLVMGSIGRFVHFLFNCICFSLGVGHWPSYNIF